MARAAELVPGGKMFVAMQAQYDAIPGEPAKHNPSSLMFDLMCKAIRQLSDEKVISRTAYERLTFPLYFRTLAEVKAPFEDELKGVLKLEHAATTLGKLPIRERFEQDGDVEAYVCELIPQIRAWAEPVLQRELELADGDMAIVDQVFERMASLVREDPLHTLTGTILMWSLVFTKQP